MTDAEVAEKLWRGPADARVNQKGVILLVPESVTPAVDGQREDSSAGSLHNYSRAALAVVNEMTEG